METALADTIREEDELLPAKIYLVDQSPRLVAAWKQAFAVFPEVEALAGDYFQRPAEALVSPANSFGIMDGGLDLAIRDKLGYSVQSRVQQVIVDKHHGELPVGAAEIVATDHPDWKYLVCAPTMRVPEPVPYSIHAYLAFRAVLVAVMNFNQQRGRREIDSLVCCGLGTGIGQIAPDKCAAQMRIAYQTMLQPAMIRSFASIHELHRALKLT
jgi:O-acetyl-ADP-ribose deacetylase (regulator of RNase III)